MSKRIVIALGGNALEKKGLPPTAESQLCVARETVGYITDIIAQGNEVIISHGNGPQVGRILLASEHSADITPPMPFDVCGAMSQGYIGYHLQQALQDELLVKGIKKPAAALVTQVIVDKNDPAFQNPTKPVGPFYTKEQADKLIAEKGWAVKEDAGRGFRRVVPSPRPVQILELEPIKALLSAGCIVIACGGGGIPVIEEDEYTLSGIAAVIDKDFASEKLAESLDADVLLILTEVDSVRLNFKQPEERELSLCTPEEIRAYEKEGHFAPGSMLPKVQAAAMFAESKPGRTAIITSISHSAKALAGDAGTRIIRN